MALDESVSVAPTPVFTRIARSSRDTFEFSGGFPSSGDDQRAATDAVLPRQSKAATTGARSDPRPTAATVG